MESPTSGSEWPYPLRQREETVVETGVLVLGGGIAGCWAAIAAAREGVEVTLVEKGATVSSGAAGSGCDHWESAATNPCSRVTPEELTRAMIADHGGYNNGISHYIECREGYDRLLDLEAMGGKIRDSEDEFVGAEFRDEKTKFLFAYDYVNRFTLRVWGTTFKSALHAECRRLGVRVIDRTMATSLLSEGGREGGRIIGATAVNGRTGEFLLLRAGATVLAMSRPTRIWLFSTGMPGLSEFRPPQCTGDGHAMGWKAGVEFTMMEKSVQAEWSGERSYPPYGTGNTHNTWYACSMVDAEGREIPWIDRDGTVLESVSERYRPAPGQKFFIKGGGESYFPLPDYLGPDTLPVDQLLEQGFKLPFYADLPGMPELERRAIWGLMVGEEGKTKVPILENYTGAGFDPDTHLLQSYGDGWRSGAFLPQERQLFGLPGGMMNDWELRTNLEGLYAAGDQLFASNCHGHAAATGHYAGRHAALLAMKTPGTPHSTEQAGIERERIMAPLHRRQGPGWKELNAAIARHMQHHCGAYKTADLLESGLAALDDLEEHEVPRLRAGNPHELIRTLEVMNILTNARLILHASLARQASSKHLHFHRLDHPDLDPPGWFRFITVRMQEGDVVTGERPIDYYGSLEENYEQHNRSYLAGGAER